METLNARLAAMKAEKDAKRDPAWTAIMQGATDALARSGIVERVRGVGDIAPLFARPSVLGETVRLRSLVARGPVIVSFFRGRW